MHFSSDVGRHRIEDPVHRAAAPLFRISTRHFCRHFAAGTELHAVPPDHSDLPFWTGDWVTEARCKLALPPTSSQCARDSALEFRPFGRVRKRGLARGFAGCAASCPVAGGRSGRGPQVSVSRGRSGGVRWCGPCDWLQARRVSLIICCNRSSRVGKASACALLPISVLFQ